MRSSAGRSGPPLVTEQLKNQRLSRPLALGGLSSAAYGTQEILRALLPFFGLAAFSLVLPVTLVVLAGTSRAGSLSRAGCTRRKSAR